ncbi:MAG: TlyA family RNA methyltransferase [Actinomycetia bacterium]|nr:TlyA family RNA methyltransferase [Actinomycetes bacterium]MCP4084223.1 TlyA family RNA methyltransferase [Actinomycetes bacterium]
MRRCLDAELVRRGLASSREKAEELIVAGRVTVSGAPAAKATRLVEAGEAVEVQGPPAPFVGRGGEKLEGALDQFAVDAADRVALDAGSSTGGFTDCLLQRGATRVHAIDVGRNQLHERLRDDERVHSMERTDIRTVTADDLGGPVDLTVTDVSFISLLSVADSLVALTREGGDLVLLVKPQFEVGREAAAKGKGIIADPELWAEALRKVADGLNRRGVAIMEGMVSPIRGAGGNVEFLIHGRIDGSGVSHINVDQLVASVEESKV